MDFAQQVKSSVDIVRVVGDYVRLKKQGPERWVGLCPFHSEKTPSFSVHARMQIFKCFGCGKGGDVFNFLMDYQGLTFFEAMKTLAEQQGIPLPERRGGPEADAEARLRGALFEMQEIAQQFFREQLASPAGAAAREYLKRRGIERETVERFGLGYAPRGDRLAGVLRRRGFEPEQMVGSGLVGKPEERPGFYDRFRDRLIFPIASESGKLIAFAGRALREDQQPKYLNSPETRIYEKSRTLYNLDRAKQAMRRENRAVLVEGYMDVIGVAPSGVEEMAACCGTSLTPLHVRLLGRLVDAVVVNFDSDSAGRSAAEKSIEILLREGVAVKVLELPEGMDPDEFCRARGPDAYRELIEQAPGYFTWLTERARKRFDLGTIEGRLAAFEFLKPSIQSLRDKIQRAALAAELAEQMGVAPSLVLDEFRRASIERTRGVAPVAPVDSLSPSEKLLLTVFLESAPARAELLPRAAEVSAEESLASERIFAALLAVERSGDAFSFSSFEGRLEETDRETVSRVLFDRDRGGASFEEGRQALAALERQCWEKRYRNVRRRIAEAEKGGDGKRAIELLGERMNLERKLGMAPPVS